MRSSFIDTLVELAENNSKIMLLTGDLGYSVLERFRDRYPKQFVNVGIAEQNMAGIAAGLAMEGHIVFIYSIGNFPTLRCMEQIRYDICYNNLSVKIIAVGAGYAYGPLGTSHHTTEDLGMLRAIPNLCVCAPGDPLEVVASTKFLLRTHGPGYMRINKAGERAIHKNKLELTGNEILPIRAGTHTAVLTTGAILDYADRFIEQEKKTWALYSIPFLNEVNPDVLIKIAQEFDRIIVSTTPDGVDFPFLSDYFPD
jgi:transketolase